MGRMATRAGGIRAVVACCGALLFMAAAPPPAPPSAEESGPPPARPPSPCHIAIAAPAETAILYGTTDVVADVVCPEGTSATQVTFLVDGRPVAELTHPPWRATWDAGGGFAAHLIEARLTDARGGAARVIVVTAGAVLQETVRVTSQPIDLVELSVSVLDASGQPVPDLTRDDFVVEEEGRKQILDDVRREERPLSVAVLIDVSSSVRPFWPRLRAAAPALARTLAAGDAIKVVAFSGPAYLVQDFTSSPVRVARAMERFQEWGGGTSLYDTLAAVGTEMAWARGGRQAVVLITDGIDTISRIDSPRLRNYLRRTDLVVETFLVHGSGSNAGGSEWRFVKAMERLSRETGGSLSEVRSTDDMTAAFRDLGTRLRARYLVSYHSDRTKRGGWRSLRVTVRRPDCVVRARHGVIGTRPIGDFLLADLESGNAPTRRKAAEWLATMPAEGAGEALLGALNDRDATVRQTAAVSLGRIREPRAITPLVAMLQTSDLGGRLAASEGLQAFGPAAVPELVAALEAPPMAGASALEGRIATLGVLAQIGDARAVEAMIRLAAAPPPPARNDRGDVIPTEANERHAEHQVRVAALHALGAMGSDDGLPSLQRAARERNAEIRDAGFTALREHAGPQAFKLLHQMGQEGEDDPAVRATARSTLIEGFMTLARRGTLNDWLKQPLGAAIFSFAAADAAADAARRPPGSWAPLFDALGGPAATAGFLEAAAAHLPTDAATQARSLGNRLRLQAR